MPTIFEGIAASNRDNLVRLGIEREAIQRDQDVFNLRDRFASTFAFENALASSGDPLQALSAAQRNTTLGGFQQLFGTQLNAQSGLLNLQRQQQANQSASILTDILRELGADRIDGQPNQPPPSQLNVPALLGAQRRFGDFGSGTQLGFGLDSPTGSAAGVFGVTPGGAQPIRF